MGWFEDNAPSKSTGGDWFSQHAPGKSTAPIPDVVAPTIKGTNPVTDFDRAVSLPGVTNPEKTKWEQAKEMVTTPLVNRIAVEGGAPNIGSLEVGGGSWKTEPVTKRVSDVLAEKGGGPISGASRAIGNIAAGLTSPLNISMLTGMGALPKMASAGVNAAFTAEQALQLPEQARAVKEAFTSPDSTSGDKVQAALEFGGSTALGILGAKGAIHDARTAPQTQRFMAPRIASDLDAATDIAYGLGKNRASRGAGRAMMDSAIDGTANRMAKFELPPTPVPNVQGGVVSQHPGLLPKISDQVIEGNERTAKLLEEIDKFATPPPVPSKDLPPRPVKSAKDSADVFSRSGTRMAELQPQVDAFDHFRRTYGGAPSQNLTLPRAPRKPVVPEEGPSIHEQRMMDAAERAGVEYATLTPQDRAALEELVTTPDNTRYKPPVPEPAPAPVEMAPVAVKPMRTPEQLVADIHERNAKFQREQTAREVAEMPRETVRLTDEGAIIPDRPQTFQESQEARRSERMPLPERPAPPEPPLLDQVVEASGPAPVTPPVDTRAQRSAEAAKALGYDPANMSLVDKAIVESMLSSNPKKQAAAVKKYRRRATEAGAWKPFSGNKATLSPSEQYALEMVEKREAARRAMKHGKNRLTPARALWMETKSNVVDQLAPIDDLFDRVIRQNNGKYDILPSREFETAAAKVYRAPTLAGQFAKDKGLVKLIQDLPTQLDVDNLDQLLIARHAAELDPSIRTGRDAARDAQLVSDLTPRYQKEIDGIRQYTSDLMDYIVESGLKSREQMDALKAKYPDYADFHRVLPEALSHQGTTRGVASKASTSVIQKLIGSDKLEIDSPLGNLMEKTHQAFIEGQQNQAAKTAAEYRHLPGMDKYLKEVPRHAVENMDPHDYFSYLDKGKPRYIAAPREFVAAAKSLNAESMGLLGQIFFGAVRIFKAGTTQFDPAFAVGNVLRDQGTRYINQTSAPRFAQNVTSTKSDPLLRVGEITGINTAVAKGTAEAITNVVRNFITKDSPLYDEMVRNAGGGNSFDLYRNQPVLSVRDVRAQKNLKTRTKNLLRGGLRELESVIGMSEDAARLQAYSTAKSNALSRGLSEKEAQAVAGKASRQSTADFYRGGNWKRTMMVVYPYINANIQGTRSTLRAMQSDPAGTMVRTAIGVAIPTAIAQIWNTSSPERKKAWDDIADWEKDKHFIILPDNPKKDDKGRYASYKLPMAPGVSEVGGLVRKNIAAQTGGDPVKAKAYAEALFNFLSPLSGTGDQLVGQMVPQIGKPIIEATFNKNFYTNKPVEPSWMEKRPMADRRFDSTSGTASMIGDLIGAPPVRVDHVLKGMGGGVTSQVLHYGDVARKAAADAIPGDNAVLKYLRDTPVGGESTPEKLTRRFAESQGGAIDEKEMAETEAVRQKVAEETAPDDRIANDLFKKWKADKAFGDEILKMSDDGKLSEHTEDVLQKLIESENMGLSKWERDLRMQPVSVRAERIMKMAHGKTDEEVDQLEADLTEKKILTPSVIEAIAERAARLSQ